MRWARPERRPGWPVVILAALVGVAAGLSLPRAQATGAVFVDAGTVNASFQVGTCSGSWSAAVAGLAPLRHWDFSAASTPAGDLPAPGLLVCDPSGALSLHGAAEENVTDPSGAIPEVSFGAVALWVQLSDTAATGDLVWAIGADGTRSGLRVSGGQLEVVEVPAPGDPVSVLAQAAAPGPGPHLVTLARAGGDLTLYVDASAVATATLSATGTGDLTLVVGAPTGSTEDAATGAVDEVLVLPVTPSAAQVAALVAANAW